MLTFLIFVPMQVIILPQANLIGKLFDRHRILKEFIRKPKFKKEGLMKNFKGLGALRIKKNKVWKVIRRCIRPNLELPLIFSKYPYVS
jgi:hypothetical protein